MNKTVKCSGNSAMRASIRCFVLTSMVVVLTGGVTIVADQAQPSATTTASARVALSPTSDLPEPLPLMIPDDAWKRLTLTAEQKAQLAALRTNLYSDQLATVHNIAPQGKALRAALIAAKQTLQQTNTVTTLQNEDLAKLQGQILELTTPLMTRYDQFVVDTAILLDSAQRTELAKAAKSILAEKQLDVLAANLGLGDVVQTTDKSNVLAPVDSIPLQQDDDSDGLPSAWELQHKLAPLDSSDTGIDTDGDWLVNYTEYLLNLDPQNPDDLENLPADWKQKLAQNAADRAKRVADHDIEKQKQDDAKKLSAISNAGSSTLTNTNNATTSGVVVRIINPPHGSTVK